MSVSLQPRPRCLWLGQLVSEEFLQGEIAASAAGNRWQTGLLEALAGAGRGIRVLGCTPQAAWPRGRFFAPPHEAVAAEGDVRASMSGYVNLPLLKLGSQRAVLLRAARRLVRQHGKPRVTLTYNAGMPEALTARALQDEFGIPWVCVLADFPGHTEQNRSILRTRAIQRYGHLQREWLGEASGVVYLSWWLYERDPRPAKLHLEGGVTAIRRGGDELGSDTSRPPIVFFAGNLSAWTGIDLLLQAFAHVRTPCQLWICGRGDMQGMVVEAAERDPRIRFFGLVSQSRLDELMSEADVFINPRPSHLPENQDNFPSKVLEYLSWCRPTLSTFTPGVSPDYRSVLIEVRSEQPAGIAETIEDVLARSPEELRRIAADIREFAERRLLWSAQAQRLWNWLEQERLLADG
jgi:glycosyltransferase involved in cell wall biosynthesis